MGGKSEGVCLVSTNEESVNKAGPEAGTRRQSTLAQKARWQLDQRVRLALTTRRGVAGGEYTLLILPPSCWCRSLMLVLVLVLVLRWMSRSHAPPPLPPQKKARHAEDMSK